MNRASADRVDSRARIESSDRCFPPSLFRLSFPCYLFSVIQRPRVASFAYALSQIVLAIGFALIHNRRFLCLVNVDQARVYTYRGR